MIFLKDYTLIDIETTGMSPNWDRIIELVGLKVRDHKVVDQLNCLVKYQMIILFPRK
jgi:DNA polymerase III subunit epsilon